MLRITITDEEGEVYGEFRFDENAAEIHPTTRLMSIHLTDDDGDDADLEDVLRGARTWRQLRTFATHNDNG